MRTAVYVGKIVGKKVPNILQQKNGENCVYSPLKRKYKSRDHSTRHSPTDRPPREAINEVEAPPPLSTASFSERLMEDEGSNSDVSQFPKLVPNTLSHPLYVDQLLEIRQSTGRTQNASFLLGVSFMSQSFKRIDTHN